MTRSRLVKAARIYSCEAPAQRKREHPQVRRKAPDRMLERRGLVVLHEEVPRPGEGISAQHGRYDEQRPPQRQRREDQHDRERRAAEMQRAREGLLVLIQIERPELGEGLHAGTLTPQAHRYQTSGSGSAVQHSTESPGQGNSRCTGKAQTIAAEVSRQQARCQPSG